VKLPRDFNTRWLHYVFLAGAVIATVWLAISSLKYY